MLSLIPRKHKYFFFNNVEEDVADCLCAHMGFTKVDDLGKYLGMPLFHSRVGRGTFSFILDKIRGRLNG